jgi:nitroreductase
MKNLNFEKLVKQRISVRKFSDKPVSDELINQCLESARLAPSACNSQPWRFTVIKNNDVKQKIKDKVFTGIYSTMKWVCNAPVLIVISAKPDFKANVIGKTLQGTNYYLIDIGIAGEHIVLQAEELGLSTCWIGWFNAKKLKKVLNLKHKPVIIICIGYHSEKIDKTKKPKIRKNLKDITEYI